MEGGMASEGSTPPVGTLEPEEGLRPSRRILFLLPVLIFVGLAALFGVRLFSGDPARVPSALIGQPAPKVTLPPLDGLRRDAGPVPGWSSAELASGGKVSIVNVWASWCAPCQEEHPVLMQLAAAEKGIRLVGLNYKDKTENARRFLGTFGNPFAAVGTDADGKAAIDWGVYGVPETFIVGPDGVIRYKHVGPLTPTTLPGFMAQVRKAAAGR
jgi:cytochrome c biogenesis protein CcmG/thiol:disulfide interchange protein DsbE